MVTIGELLQTRATAWRLTLVAGDGGLGNGVTIPRIQKPGLALAGYLPQIHPERVQIIGRTELGYLATLDEDAARAAVDRVLGERVACVIVTHHGDSWPLAIFWAGVGLAVAAGGVYAIGAWRALGRRTGLARKSQVEVDP